MVDKKTIAILMVCIVMLLSCRHSSDNNQASNPLSGAQAMDLAKKSGCLACHSIEKRIVGPAWRAVSERYKGDTTACSQLVEKVTKGGSGNWNDITNNAPMPPYSPRVSDKNIRHLVGFVLSIAGSGCAEDIPELLPLNTDPVAFNLKSGDQSRLYFDTHNAGVNLLHTIEIIMVNGIIDVSIEYPDRNGNPVVLRKFSTIHGQLNFEIAPQQRFYDLNITAQTDASFVLSITTNPLSFLTLAKMSGCLACHNTQKKVVGPAWIDVSNRYRGDANAQATLIEKIKTGGKGNWTDITGGAPMPPYSPRVSEKNIGILVQEILKLE